jgi:hypothetical protein
MFVHSVYSSSTLYKNPKNSCKVHQFSLSRLPSRLSPVLRVTPLLFVSLLPRLRLVIVCLVFVFLYYFSPLRDHGRERDGGLSGPAVGGDKRESKLFFFYDLGATKEP